MSEIKNQDRILEAIDQLRRRKARPDADRICNFLLRRFCVDRKDTQEDLQRLIEAKTVIKVEYKGSISYRNAAKCMRYSKVKSNDDFTSILCGALSELIVHEPDYLDFGVPANELEKYLITKNKDLFAKKKLSVIIKRELKSGNLVKLENGNYSLVEDQPSGSTPPITLHMSSSNKTDEMVSGTSQGSKENMETSKQTVKKSGIKRTKSGRPKGSKKVKGNDVENKSAVRSFSPGSLQDADYETGSNDVGGFRVGVRRKRAAKKVFDPSDNNLPKKKRGRPFGSKNKEPREAKEKEKDKVDQVQTDFCYICELPGSNRQGLIEKLLACRDCSNKVHVKCSEAQGPAATPWQCSHCKTCCVCSETDEYETMVTCTSCHDGYHYSCHAPPVSNKFKGPFYCARCGSSKDKVEPREDLDNDNVPQPSPSASLSSPPPLSSSGVSSGGDEMGEETVPDASKWTVHQVVEYLCKQGCETQAEAFMENDIDGQSLLLLKRSDVLDSLQMKLGPALRVYKRVKMLQTRSLNPRLLWE